MTKVLVKTLFGSYTGTVVTFFSHKNRLNVVVILADNSHRVADVRNVIQLDPQAIPQPQQPPLPTTPIPTVTEHGA